MFTGPAAEQLAADLVEATRPYAQRRAELPENLAHVLLRLTEKADAHLDVSINLDSTVQVAAGRPTLPDTDGGRRLQTVRDALLAHAQACRYPA